MAKTKDKKDAPIKMPSVDYHPEYSHPSLGVRPVSWEEAQRHGHRMPTLKEMYTYIKGVFGGKTPPEKPPYREMPPVDYHPEDSPPSLGVRPARKSYDSQKHKKKRGNEGGLENGVVSSIIAIAGVLAGIFFYHLT